MFLGFLITENIHLITLCHRWGAGNSRNDDAGRGIGVGKPGRGTGMWEVAGGFPWDHWPGWMGKAACAELAVVRADLTSQAGSVQEAESISMLYCVQSLSSGTAMGLHLQLLLCEVVFLHGVDTGFPTQQFMSN